MKTGRNKFAVVILVVALLLIVLPRLPLQTTLLPLHADGRWLKDSSGNIIVLTGVNKATFLDSTTGWWVSEGASSIYDGLTTWSEAAVRAHLQVMKEWRVNLLRMHINVEWFQKNSATTLGDQATNKPYRDAIKRTIELAGEYGIYILIDVYSIAAGGQDSMPFPPYTTDPADTSLIGSVQDWVDFWLLVSTELNQYSSVLYELHNEPVGGADDFMAASLLVVNSLRANGDNHLVVLQLGYCWDVHWAETYSVFELPNIVVSTHLYWDTGGTLSYNPSTYTAITDKSSVDQVSLRMEELGYDMVTDELNLPLLIGELGGSPSDLGPYEACLRNLVDRQLSWAVWEWRHGVVYGVLSTSVALCPPEPNDAGVLVMEYLRLAQSTSVPVEPSLQDGVLTVSTTDNMQPVSVDVRVYSDMYDETYASPFGVAVAEGNYTLYTSFNEENYDRNISVVAGETTAVSFMFESELPSTISPPPPSSGFEFDSFSVSALILVVVAVGIVLIPKKRKKGG